MPPRFMVIDDDDLNNLISKFGIKRYFADIDIRVFTEGEDALTFIQQEYSNPDNEIFTILFLDINMPSMSGWEFLDIFMDLDTYVHNQFRIFILSSSVDTTDKDRAAKNPFVSGFLSKPLKSEDIKQILFQFETEITGLHAF